MLVGGVVSGSALLLLSFFVHSIKGLEISEAELQRVADELWVADAKSRLRIVGKKNETQMTVFVQNKVPKHTQRDVAPQPFFTWVDPKSLEKPTFKALKALFPHFEMNLGRQERNSAEKHVATEKFMDAIQKTVVYETLRGFLRNHGFKMARTAVSFRDFIKSTWFTEYSRTKGQRQAESSGFEHVFLGEIGENKNTREREIKGLHNWLRLYWLEKEGKLDYAGHIFQKNRFIEMKFHMGNEWKMGSSFLVGTSPEYDLAVYTLCFILNVNNNKQQCTFNLGDCTRVSFHNYNFHVRLRGQNMKTVSTVYPARAVFASKCEPIRDPAPSPNSTPATLPPTLLVLSLLLLPPLLF